MEPVFVSGGGIGDDVLNELKGNQAVGTTSLSVDTVRKAALKPAFFICSLGNHNDRMEEAISRLEDRSGTIAVAFTPYSYESDKLFRAAVQLRRISRMVDAVFLVDRRAMGEEYRQVPEKQLEAGMLRGVLELIRCSLGKEVDLSKFDHNGKHIYILLHSSSALRDGVNELILNSLKLADQVTGIRVLYASDAATVADGEYLDRGIGLLEAERKIRITEGKDELVGLVEGTSKLFDYDPVAKILGEDRTLDLEPEVEVNMAFPGLERID
ncbi:MAG: hypothetical protein JRM98_03750 [Nitrososphaerota archaeon]|nr:hypothetical protein [Nitrososphaerota archaeon]